MERYVLDWIFLKLVFVSGWCPIHTLWIKVRCRPIHLLVCFLFQILVDHSCTVRSGIVIHQNEITNGANLWSYNRCNDLIHVADTGKRSVPYDIEVCGTIVTYACPNQVWHTTKLKFSNVSLPPCLDRSFFLLHTHLRPSLKSRQHLDSSVQSTPWICLMVPFDTTFSWKRRLRCSTVNGGHNAGSPARNPASWSPFRKDCFKTPSCSPTDVEKISFKHSNGPCSFFEAWLHVKMQ